MAAWQKRASKAGPVKAGKRADFPELTLPFRVCGVRTLCTLDCPFIGHVSGCLHLYVYVCECAILESWQSMWTSQRCRFAPPIL